jgi:hypothetical protein
MSSPSASPRRRKTFRTPCGRREPASCETKGWLTPDAPAEDDGYSADGVASPLPRDQRRHSTASSTAFRRHRRQQPTAPPSDSGDDAYGSDGDLDQLLGQGDPRVEEDVVNIDDDQHAEDVVNIDVDAVNLDQDDDAAWGVAGGRAQRSARRCSVSDDASESDVDTDEEEATDCFNASPLLYYSSPAEASKHCSGNAPSLHRMNMSVAARAAAAAATARAEAADAETAAVAKEAAARAALHRAAVAAGGQSLGHSASNSASSHLASDSDSDSTTSAASDDATTTCQSPSSVIPVQNRRVRSAQEEALVQARIELATITLSRVLKTREGRKILRQEARHKFQRSVSRARQSMLTHVKFCVLMHFSPQQAGLEYERRHKKQAYSVSLAGAKVNAF